MSDRPAYDNQGIPLLDWVEPLSGWRLLCRFRDGSVRLYDASILPEQPVFQEFRDAPLLFMAAHASGGGIVWTRKTDLSAHAVLEDGVLLVPGETDPRYAGCLGELEGDHRFFAREDGLPGWEVVVCGLDEKDDYRLSRATVREDGTVESGELSGYAARVMAEAFTEGRRPEKDCG